MAVLGLRGWKFWAALAANAGGIGYLVFAKHLDFSRSLIAVRGFSVGPVAAAIGLVVLQNLFQASRLWILLPDRTRLRWSEVIAAVTWGQLVNVYAPARAGDIVKIGLISTISRRGQGHVEGPGQPDGPSQAAKIAGTVLVADKVADVAALVLAVALVAPRLLLELHVPHLPAGWGPALWILPLGALALGLVLLRSSRGRRAVSQFATGSLGALRPLRLLEATACGALAWCAEAITLMVLARSAGFPLSFSQGLVVLLILNLAVAVPVLPANLIAFEGSVALGLARYGMPASTALAVGVAHHLLQVAGVASLALVLALARRRIARIPGQ